MCVNEVGNLAEKFWSEIPNHFSNVELGNFVIMPNHMHGILILNSLETLHCNVCTTAPNGAISKMSQISPKSGSVSTIIRSYKSVVSKHAHFINQNFAWQDRFYDRIIRTEEEYMRIAKYIDDNPAKW